MNSFRALLIILTALVVAVALPAMSQDRALVGTFLSKVGPDELVPGATGFGPVRDDIPVVAVLKGAETVGWAFLTSDFVGTTGYSGKPIHVIVGVSPDAIITGVKLVEHSEPIVLIGIPNSKVQALTGSYAGVDLRAEAESGGASHDLDIISGATVTIMVIDDSIIRAGLKVARALGLGGLEPTVRAGPARTVDLARRDVSDWSELAGNGAVRSLTLDIGQVNAAYETAGDARAIARPEPGDPAETFIEMKVALVSVPSIGISLMGAAEYANLTGWLQDGEHAILVAGRGRYSFKGSGYVRGGIFDRIQLIQGDRSVRFFDRDHKRLGGIAAAGAPSFTELDIFRIPADAEFEPGAPWRLQLLAQRSVGAIEKSFLTFDLGYRLPEPYLVAQAPIVLNNDAEEASAKSELWQRIWYERRFEIAGLAAMLLALTVIFFFQKQVTRNERVFDWIRIGFLTVTLVFLGWYANAQLSVVNLMALGGALKEGFTWDAFLLDPLVFILWFSVATSLIFWGRGAYCGWLCPFGALQELTNKVARALKVPQWTLPWGLNERLWPLKYIIFLGLFGISLASIPLAETFAEVEPFKTAIILKFAREWWFVAFALSILTASLFIERFYCRYMCPLGGALAIPARMRMFNWLKRYHECGNPCHLCANECPVQAIHPTGEINPNECINCLHCQVLYQSEDRCPVVVKKVKRMERRMRGAEVPVETVTKREFRPDPTH